MEVAQTYTPSEFQQTQNTLYANHFKFEIERLPDLSFFVQKVSIPNVDLGVATQPNPFHAIHHPGTQLTYGSVEVTYLIDAKFKNYFSLYYWMKGVGFPHNFEEVENFRAQQLTLQGNPRAHAVDLEKTRGTLIILQPDTGAIVAEILLEELFPMGMSAVEFSTSESDSPILTTTCTFSCSSFEVKTFM
jgi:hypothetical protein